MHFVAIHVYRLPFSMLGITCIPSIQIFVLCSASSKRKRTHPNVKVSQFIANVFYRENSGMNVRSHEVCCLFLDICCIELPTLFRAPHTLRAFCFESFSLECSPVLQNGEIECTSARRVSSTEWQSHSFGTVDNFMLLLHVDTEVPLIVLELT